MTSHFIERKVLAIYSNDRSLILRVPGEGNVFPSRRPFWERHDVGAIVGGQVPAEDLCGVASDNGAKLPSPLLGPFDLHYGLLCVDGIDGLNAVLYIKRVRFE